MVIDPAELFESVEESILRVIDDWEQSPPEVVNGTDARQIAQLTSTIADALLGDLDDSGQILVSRLAWDQLVDLCDKGIRAAAAGASHQPVTNSWGEPLTCGYKKASRYVRKYPKPSS